MATAMADIHVKVDREIKNESEEVLKQIGISFSDLINMTLRRVIYERRIPFSTKVGVEGAPEHLRINSREELEALLTKTIEEDDGTRLTVDEVWGNLDKHIKDLKTARTNEEIQNKIYA